jgi:uncharacterized protein YggE
MFDSLEGKRLLKFSSWVLILLGVFLAVEAIHTIVVTGNIDRSTPATNLITVNGKGEIFAPPDVATFSFGTLVTAKTVAEAQKGVTDKINNALDIVKKAGIEAKDIKTISYNINPHYEFIKEACIAYVCPPPNQKISGYEVSQMVEVKIRQIEKASDILSQLGSAEVTNLSGLIFTIDNQDKVQTDAQTLAITDAKNKAKKLAQDLGVGLGRLVSFNESAFPVPMYGVDAVGGIGGGAMPKVQLPTGQNMVTSNVASTYEVR